MRKLIVLALVLASIPAAAQQPQPQAYAPPDAELWGIMVKAFSDLPMAFTTHQQMQQIMANVQQEAQRRAAVAKAPAAPPAAAPGKPAEPKK